MMAFFTDISNKYGFEVENSHKNLRNILRCIVRRLLVFCVLGLSVIQAVFPTPFATAAPTSSPPLPAEERSVSADYCSSLSAVEKSASARLVCAEISDATVTLEIFLGGVSLCGLLAEITYDASKVSFASADIHAEISERGGNLSYTEADGRLTLALDCCHNCFSGDMAELVFAFADPKDAETSFSLALLSAYAWEGDALVELSTCEPSAIAVSPKQTADKDTPTLNSVEISVSGDSAVFSVSGTAPERSFAAGVELCIADLSSLDVERVCAVGVINQNGDKSEFVRDVNLPAKGRFCVIVKPVSYCRTGAVCGREIILLIENGSILY